MKMGNVKELILFREFDEKDAELFYGMASVLEKQGDLSENLYRCIHLLLDISSGYGFEGNLWQTFLTYLLVSNENAYSKACEIRGATGGSINQIALHDFAIFKSLFEYDLGKLGRQLGVECMPDLLEYKRATGVGKTFNSRIRDRICELSVKLKAASTVEEFKDDVTEFYRDYGVGKLGLHKAFRIEHRDGGAKIVPITNIAHVHLDDLVGYGQAKQKLVENTEAFLEGRPANNCLLYGDAGTGKSSSIKAIVNQYYDRGLRMIELYKHQLMDLPDVISQVKNRNYRFIIYMDDLSFEEFETEYKYLKAVIEGGLEKKPENVLIYATSNRRHLIRENFRDKEEVREDMHTSDTVQEKLSLVYRFGVSIYFGAPAKKEFDQIVLALAKRNGVDLPDGELLAQASRWELDHGGLSGRTAQQFIDHMLGCKES